LASLSGITFLAIPGQEAIVSENNRSATQSKIEARYAMLRGLTNDQRGNQTLKTTDPGHLAFLRELQSQNGTSKVQATQLAAKENIPKGLDRDAEPGTIEADHPN
jgi:hypothetical protein